MRLFQRAEAIDSEENLKKQYFRLYGAAGKDKKKVLCRGYSQNVYNNSIGSKFPFIIGVDEEISQDCDEWEGIRYSPSIDPLTYQYDDIKRDKIKGRINPISIEFVKTGQILSKKWKEIEKNLPHKFARAVASILDCEEERERQRLNRYKEFYTGIFTEQNKYEGKFGDYYYNKKKIFSKGIFTLERLLEKQQPF